jgi:hypothetical protein
MKSQILGSLVAGAIAFTPGYVQAQGDTLTSVDRTRIVRELEESNQHFLAAITGLTEAQWRFKASPTRWSIAEVAEHLTLVEEGVGGMSRTQAQPIPAFSADSSAKLEAGVRELYGNRTRKMNSPEGFVPTGRYATQADLVAAYNTARQADLEYIRTTRDPLRARGGPHPAFGGNLDVAHWMIVITAHMERHLHQIEEVKKAEGYPGR